MTPQDEAKQYANARFFESDRANGEAWVISYTAYLDALTSEKLRSSKLLEGMVSKEEYDDAINEIGQLQEQLKEANEYIRDLQKGYDH